MLLQNTHFTCTEDYRVLRDDFDVFSAFGSICSAGVSLLLGSSLNAIVNLVFAGNGIQLTVADIAVKSFEFRVVAVYRPIALAGDALFSVGRSRSLMIGNG